MPECCLCDAVCTSIIFAVVLIFIVIVLIIRSNPPSISQVSNQTNNPGSSGPPPPPPKNKCIEALKCILGCGALLLFLTYLACLYPINVYKYFIYDTNKEYSDLVIASLKVNKLMTLDKLLMIEKAECGLRISDVRVNTIVDGDQQVIDAYACWRYIYNLRRSHDHTIYPDERDEYIIKYSLLWPRKMLVKTNRLLPFCHKLPLPN